MIRSIARWLRLLWRPKTLWALVRLRWLILRIKATNFLLPGVIDEHLKTMEGQLWADETRKMLQRAADDLDSKDKTK